jgi:hypothetical protein
MILVHWLPRLRARPLLRDLTFFHKLASVNSFLSVSSGKLRRGDCARSSESVKVYNKIRITNQGL